MWIKTKDVCYNLNNCTSIEVRKNITSTYDLIINGIGKDIVFLRQSDNEADLQKVLENIWICIKADINHINIK